VTARKKMMNDFKKKVREIASTQPPPDEMQVLKDKLVNALNHNMESKAKEPDDERPSGAE